MIICPNQRMMEGGGFTFAKSNFICVGNNSFFQKTIYNCGVWYSRKNVPMRRIRDENEYTEGRNI